MADYDDVYFSSELEDKLISWPNQWQHLTSLLQIELQNEKYTTVGYSVVVQPQLNLRILKDRKFEYISSRIVVDGVAFEPGSDTHGTTAWNPTEGILSGLLSTHLAAIGCLFRLPFQEFPAFLKAKHCTVHVQH